MKRCLLALAVALLCSVPARAQVAKSLTVGYGFMPMNASYNHYTSRHTVGAFALGGQVALNPWLRVGLEASFAPTSYDAASALSLEQHALKDNSLAALATVQVVWRNAERLRMYYGGGVGLEWRLQKSHRGTFSSLGVNYQLTLFGIEVGQRLYGLCEVGYGCNGIVRLGGGVRF